MLRPRTIVAAKAAGLILPAIVLPAMSFPALAAASAGHAPSTDFMPHGYCYLWDPLVLWLNVISDALITLSYYCIPAVLIYFARRHRELPFNRIFWMFGVFILACGTTHLLEVWNIWHANYLLAGATKAITAAASVITALMIVPLIPKAVALPASIDLLWTNRRLEREIAARTRFDTPVETSFRHKVALGFVTAVLITALISASSWHGARRAEQDAYWVSHTHEVMESIQRTTRHLIETETSARAFSLTGEEKLLVHYQTVHDSVGRDVAALRSLTADNPSQQRRLDTLEPQIRAAIQFADGIIAKRRSTHSYPGPGEALETEKLLESVRTVTHDMYGEETRLLQERVPRIEQGQRQSRIVSLAGAVVLGGLWLLALFVVNREIYVSSQARAQVTTLNAELELRVAERTAELEAINHTMEQEIQARRKSEERLREQARVLDMTTVLVREIDGRIAWWTQGAEQLYGYSSDEAIGRISHELFQTKFPESLKQMENSLAQAGRWEGELEHRKKDGSAVFVASVQTVYRDEQGRAIRVLEANTDITPRKRAEERLAERTRELSRQTHDLMITQEALREQKRILQLVLDSMDEGLIAADGNGVFLLWNQAAERILGQGPATIPPEKWSAHYGVYLPDGVTLVPTEQLPMVRAIAGEQCESELVMHHPDSSRTIWLEVAAHPLRDGQGSSSGGVIVLRDTTERKNHEREIRRLNESLEQRVIERTAQLEAANKELEAFSYSVSHDLRAPLRHISGFSKILEEDFSSALPDEARDHLRRIQDGSHRMGLLIDELLSLARVGRQALRPEVSGLNTLVTEIIALLSPDYEGRQVEWKIADLPFVECDAGLMRQVFQNLISNALKYSRTREKTVIEIGQTRIEGETAVYVRDNGVGFSMKYVDKLFGVFQRLHRHEDFEGTGVGLATVQRIIRKHGGRVWAEAEIDRGATFYFTLNTGDSTGKVADLAAAMGAHL